MVWYKQEDWKQLRRILPDSYLLPKKYKDWLARAEEKERQVRDSGSVVIKVFIDPITFPAWCRKKGREMDAESRTMMAIEVATTRQFGERV